MVSSCSSAVRLCGLQAFAATTCVYPFVPRHGPFDFHSRWPRVAIVVALVTASIALLFTDIGTSIHLHTTIALGM